jgi:hypothetical protein
MIYDDQKWCPRAGTREMYGYGSAAIERQNFEKAQTEFAIRRPLNISQISVSLSGFTIWRNDDTVGS